jgi:broad specificity phosphatase PhoE
MDSDKRVLWICRHGERIDQVDPNWRHSARAYDDPPLGDRGVVQAKETGERLKHEQIDAIFASPFERCVHTAQMIVDARDQPIPIFLEQGITEAPIR